ncbi:ankyrin repeat domain-containing protein [Devosia sp.]|uniref:ankyrin repeat domain-containing protein n=1 Tax=Devosia sp. TaxID=1871048 RepID=UPI0032635046
MALTLLTTFFPITTWAQTVPIDAVDFALKNPARPVDYYDGLRAADAGQKEVAITLWLSAAQLGDGKAMLEIAKAYAAGDILPKSPILAAYYFALGVRFGQTPTSDPFVGLDPADVSKIKAEVAQFAPEKFPPVEAAATHATFADFLGVVDAGDIEGVRMGLSVNPTYSADHDANGWTALMHAALIARGDIVQLLLDKGAEVRAVTNEGYTALHFAALTGSDEIAQLLIEHGASTLIATPKGLAPAMVASDADHAELAKTIAARAHDEMVAVQKKLNLLGYDVGTADGTAGSITISQLAVFAHGFSLPNPNISYPLLARLSTIQAVRVWGVVVDYTKDGGEWRIWRNITAQNRKAAEDELIGTCKSTEGAKKCAVEFSVPLGSCMALAMSDSDEAWSKIFSTKAAAEADGLEQCSKQSSRSTCKVQASFCVN